MTGYSWPCSWPWYSHYYWPQQRNRPISSHFDLMLGQWQMYISIHVLPTVLYTFPVATTRSISFNNQIILHLLIIFFFLTTFLFDGQGSIYGEIECWSFLEPQGLLKIEEKKRKEEVLWEYLLIDPNESDKILVMSATKFCR